MNPQPPVSQHGAMRPPPIMNPPPQIFGNANGGATNSPGYSQEQMREFASGGHWFQRDVGGGASNNDMNYSYDDQNDDDGGADNDDGPGGDGSNKRRRIARACDMCRKKKIKCDGKMPKCSHCINYKTECIFTQVEKKRNPPKGAKYIEGLENRLGRMESLLRLSGLLAEDDGRTDLGTLEKRLQERHSSERNSTGGGGRSNPASPDGVAEQTPSSRGGAPIVSTPRTSNATPQDHHATADSSPQQKDSSTTLSSDTAAPKKETPQSGEKMNALADQMCSLITNNCGETRYIGSSSGFSIFSPKGIQWVNEKTGDNSFQQMIVSAAKDNNHWDHWKPEVFNDLFGRRVFKQLPGKQQAYSLLRDYFENFNCMFPLFHEPTFMHLVEKHYSLDPYEGSGWWASLNVALAIAHRLRVMSNVVDQEEDEHAWGYLKNAMAVMTELTMRNTDLLSVQALLGMALFLQGTPNPQPSFFLVSAAIRLSHSIGLHKRGSGFNLNEVENEQRKRVFWIAYLMDKDICLRSGRPPAQDDDDMNVELPSEDPPDNVGNVPLSKETSDGRNTMNLFRLMCTFAQIQSTVYKQLYSVKASRQSDGELLNTIGELDQALEEWKDSIPMDFRPEHEIKASHTPLILHVVVLHFAYYNCLTTIHRMSVHHGYWTSRLSDYAIQGLNARPLNPRVFMSAALCVNAARTSIGLIRYIPQGDYACVWLILYYPVSALVTLFANILQNPQDARARSDLKLMSSVISFLTMIERDTSESNGNVQRMLSVCGEFERIARVVLDKAERELRGRGKRKQAEREKEKDRRDGTISAALEDGKTLEELQIETQRDYRRPVQTPSMRASIASSQQGSGAGASPASWGTPNSGAGSDHRQHYSGPGAQYLSPGDGQQPPQTSNGQWNPTPPGMTNIAKDMRHNMGSMMVGNQDQSPRQPANFSEPQPHTSLTSGFDPNSASMSGPNINDPLSDFSMNNFSPDLNTGLGGSFNGSFQQPFVPQDLWQMPMTLEWDWAEGLGMGAFTPNMAQGMMFNDAGSYMDGNMAGRQPDGGGQ